MRVDDMILELPMFIFERHEDLYIEVFLRVIVDPILHLLKGFVSLTGYLRL